VGAAREAPGAVIRVVIAEDEDLMREALRSFLDADAELQVVAEAASGRDAVQAARLHRPDVVLMDVQMPGMDGIEATRRLAPDGPRVLVLTTFGHDAVVYEALRAGAAGFLLKTTSPAELRAAIRVVAAGDALLAPELTRRLIADHVRRPRAEARPPALGELTGRELEVLRAIAAGRSNAEIAAELVLGEATVKTHVNRIFRKLGLRDRAQAVVVAYESGLVAPGG
jgi:DNA-binding NarL/FixJ family response regulator